MKSPSRIFAHNVKVGRRPWLVVLALRVFIRITRPHVVVLLEAGGYVDELRKAFSGDWHAYRRHSDVVVMVRKDVPKPAITVLSHDASWRGPHEGVAHAGRKWLQLDWPDLRLIALHRVPGGPSGGTSRELNGGNAPAWRTENLLIASTLSDRADKPVLIVGDQNARPVEVGAFMHRHDLRAVVTGAKVDWAMVTPGLRVDGKRLGRRGSDHPAVLYVVR